MISRRFAVAFAVLGWTMLVCAQQPRILAPHRSVGVSLPPTGKPHKAPELRSMVGGLWMTDANMKSTIYVKNIEHYYAITVSPTLYFSNGKALVLPDVKLEPAGNASISVNDALRDLQIVPWATLYGYVEMRYTFPWDPICVTVQSVDVVHSVIFTSGLRSQQPALGSAQHVVEGMWWKQENDVTGFVTLSNATSQPLSAIVDTSDSRENNVAHHAVVVSPHGTKLVELQELASAGAVGGIRVNYNGPQDGILVNGELEDLSKGYSATIPFLSSPPPADPRSSMSFAELGLMTGAADPMMKFPAGTVFTPYSIVRNISDHPLPMVLSLYWMEGGAAKSAQLQRLVIPPHQTRDLNAPSLLAMSGLRNLNGSVNLLLNVEGGPNSLLMTGGSVDQTDTYVFESLPSPATESAGKSLSRWTIDKGDDTMVTLWNPADEAQDFIFTMFFTGGHYKYPIHMGPRATHMFNVSEIVENQVPDADGNVIPAGVHEGSAEIAGPLGMAQHILVTVAASSYNVQKATCGWFCLTCSGVIDTIINTSPFAVAVSGQVQLSYIQEWDFGDVDCTKCTGVVWSSNHTNIATVTTGMTKGVSAGSAQVNVAAPEEFVSGQSCGAPPTACHQPLHNVNPPPAPGTVGPDHLSVVSDTGLYPSQCPTTGVWVRQMKLQVVDATNTPITNNPSVQEQFSNETNNTCGNGNPIATSCGPTGPTTLCANCGPGQFDDTMSVSNANHLCDSGIQQGSGCGYNLTSTWSACASSGTKNLWISTRVVHSNGVEIDGQWTSWPGGSQCTTSGCQ